MRQHTSSRTIFADLFGVEPGEAQTNCSVNGKSQSELNLDATLGYINRTDFEPAEASYYCLKVSQYIGQLIFNEPGLRFEPKKVG